MPKSDFTRKNRLIWSRCLSYTSFFIIYLLLYLSISLPTSCFIYLFLYLYISIDLSISFFSTCSLMQRRRFLKLSGLSLSHLPRELQREGNKTAPRISIQTFNAESKETSKAIKSLKLTALSESTYKK